MKTQTFISSLTLKAVILNFSKKKLLAILHFRIMNYLFLIFLFIYDTRDKNLSSVLANSSNQLAEPGVTI